MIYKEYLRYLDLFGTKCSFYSDQRLKFYTPLGGIISIISVCTCVVVFAFFSLSSFKREYPSLITRSIIDEEQKIIFNQENIFIPWKILKNKDNFNHSNILYPVIKYYYKENSSDIINSKILSYKICSETSLANTSINYLIDTSLDQLYCIEMKDLDIGGSLKSNYFYYIEFNLYLCSSIETCNNYDKNNFNDIDNNNYELVFYYPTVRFHGNKYKSPLDIKYDKDFVILNKYFSKLNQIYFHKITLNDETGLFSSNKRKYQYWERSKKYEDFYYKNDIEQKLFSLEIYVEQSNVYYNRKYNNILIILSDCLPFIWLVHNFLKLIAKIFKLSSINRKMTELLFENLTEKHNKFQSYIRDMKSKKSFNILSFNQNIVNNDNNNNNNNKNSKKNSINSGKNKNYLNIPNAKNTEENNIISMTNNDNSRNINNYSNVTLINKIYVNKNNNDKRESLLNVNRNNIKQKSALYNEGGLLDLKINTINLNNMTKNNEKTKNNKKYITNILFPYRYYLCTIFTKNIDLTKHPFCMSKKYVKVYYFLCQLFDISSYCILQKEFNVTKNFIFDEKKLQLIEQNSKINVNDQFFMRDMNDCIIKNKFHILGINNIKINKETNIEPVFSKK